jgi:hypothetical protein
MPDPEALAREEIDRQLALAGWTVQDRDEPVTPGIDQMEATVEAYLKRAESLRQSVLRMAFSGRLVSSEGT